MRLKMSVSQTRTLKAEEYTAESLPWPIQAKKRESEAKHI